MVERVRRTTRPISSANNGARTAAESRLTARSHLIEDVSCSGALANAAYIGAERSTNVWQGTAALTVVSPEWRSRPPISGEKRPNYVAGVSLTPPGGSIPNSECRCVSTWAPGTFGNFGRNGLRASGISQLDLGLARDVSISERVKVCFRADAFNVFKRAQYAAPNGRSCRR
jgi:hypothetical protein